VTDAPARLSAALADRYGIERVLGTGGMATVYLAQDLRHDRPVALKVLNPNLSALLGAERFHQEIRVTARLRHPHILPLYDSGEAEGALYYVMPLVEGESLRARMDRDPPLSLEEAVRLIREVADALGYAHDQGVIHRDVKPENILLENGRALVADFGIARAATSTGSVRLTQAGFSLGTPLYMSPEQASGDLDSDGRSGAGATVHPAAAAGHLEPPGDPSECGRRLAARDGAGAGRPVRDHGPVCRGADCRGPGLR
jgi:serine/threonine protein kinase